MAKPLIISSFLPGFHQCPLNSKWWGPSFSEITNVQNASKLFPGHLQPRNPIPPRYELSNVSNLQDQFTLSASNGIDCLLFYDYWSLGVRPLAQPLEILLSHKEISGTFAICWANHNWTRSWRNRAGALDILLTQDYEPFSDYNNYHLHLLRVFSDERYLKINGKLFFSIYQPSDIPDLAIFVDSLRSKVRSSLGQELHISAYITPSAKLDESLRIFDSIAIYQPTGSLMFPVNVFSDNLRIPKRRSFRYKLHSLPLSVKKLLYAVQDIVETRHIIVDYDEAWNKLLDQYNCSAQSSPVPLCPVGFVDFDNTPRYGKRARIIQGFTPYKFGKYLDKLLMLSDRFSAPYLVINAWNEFGEGMYLYPCDMYGLAKLDVLKSLLKLK